MSIFQESDRIGTGVPPSDSKLGAVVSRRESLGQRAREKGLGKHPVMYEREEETGVPLRDATCFELKVRANRRKRAWGQNPRQQEQRFQLYLLPIL